MMPRLSSPILIIRAELLLRSLNQLPVLYSSPTGKRNRKLKQQPICYLKKKAILSCEKESFTLYHNKSFNNQKNCDSALIISPNLAHQLLLLFLQITTINNSQRHQNSQAQFIYTIVKTKLLMQLSRKKCSRNKKLK